MLNKIELELCRLLSDALHGTKSQTSDYDCDWASLLETAKKHKVVPILYPVLEDADLPPLWRGEIDSLSCSCVQQSYRLLFLSKYVISLLQENGIEAILLKGSGTAGFYPIPELRKSGDVDILLKGETEAKQALEILEQVGFTRAGVQLANHHIECMSPDHISIELHMILAEPFDNKQTNLYLLQCQQDFFAHSISAERMGVTLRIPDLPYHAFYLVLHMLQHFLRAGFGLKLLCDWVVFWEQEITDEQKDTFVRLAQQSGTLGFVRTITAVCVRYLGLTQEKVSFLIQNGIDYSEEEFLSETLEAEEFGHSKADRMVVLRGTGLMSYIREFHHQTKLTYPKASRWIITYPILWIMMLCGFLYRNHSVRKVSSREIFKKAKKRSKLVEQMKLFQE